MSSNRLPIGSPTVLVTDPAAIGRAADVLQAGGTVVLPTDTVYGVAALPQLAGATAQLFALKARGSDQPLAVLLADDSQLAPLAGDIDDDVRAWTADFWPGPLTLVLGRTSEARGLELGGDPATIGVRCPDHDFVRALAALVGPLATTSANRHGEPAATNAADAATSLAGAIGLVVDGGPSGDVASTVVDATTQPRRVLRRGALEPARLGLAP
ncbi:MAG TPA: L-threonylcarbamoyladenylate synthase [Acidimicrobiales bacterium]